MKDEERSDLTTDEIKQLYGSSRSLLQLISCTMQDAAYILRLMCEFNVLPLAIQMTKIAGKLYILYNLASAVGVVCSILWVGYWLHSLWFDSQQGQEVFLFSESSRQGLVFPLSQIFSVYEGSFFGIKWQVMILTTNHQEPRLWLSRAIPLLHLYAFMAWTEAHLPFTNHHSDCLLSSMMWHCIDW